MSARSLGNLSVSVCLALISVSCGGAAPSTSPVTSGPTLPTVPPAPAAAKLAFTTQPGGGTGGAVWSTQPVVTVYDATGNVVTGSSASIMLTAGGGTFACTTNPLSASSGVATFAGCKINEPGSYTLTAASSGLTSATSSSLSVTASTDPQTYTTGVTGGETDLKVYTASSASGPWVSPKLVTISGVNSLLTIDPQPILAQDGSILLVYAISDRNDLPNGSTRIGIASSSDGVSFVQRGIVYTAGSDGFPLVSDPCAVLLADGRIRVYFSNVGPRVYSVTSRDASGTSFGGLDTGIRSNINAGVCGAAKVGQEFFLYENGIVYSTSQDGLTFTSKGSVNITGDAPSVTALTGGGYVMAYQPDRAGPDKAVANLATSSDGVKWSIQASSVFPGNMPGLVATRDGRLLMYVVALHNK